MKFERVEDMVLSVLALLEPKEEYTVSQAAEKYRYLNNPGAYVGKYKNSMAPYMVEPMDMTLARNYVGLCFVGPAQSSKTESLILNFIAYTVKVDPMDIMLVCPTATAARDFSIRRVDRMHRDSKEIGAMMLPGADSDNKFDKQYRNGVLLTFSYPSVTELAGKPIGRVLLTDRDRMPDDIDGDGDPYDLASKRTTTFLSNAMTVCESSPSRTIDNPKWIRASLHEAPPCAGILALYNRGNKCRWYWPCPHCGGYFEGNWSQITYTKQEGMTNMDVGATARLRCPLAGCGELIHPDQRQAMQMAGRWVQDGQAVDKDGVVFGPKIRTSIASYWLNGIAAAFTTWSKLVNAFLDANDEYEKTQNEGPLTKFYNNDLGEPYLPKSMLTSRLPETLQANAIKLQEDQVRKVPEGVRFLVALCDVQKNMWIVQIFGIMPGKPFDMVLIDRFEVKYSQRSDEVGGLEWVKPHAELDDWDELIGNVMEREYELADGSGRMMPIKLTGCDSGGKDGVTSMAYRFWRKLKDEGRHARFVLTKGSGKPGHPRTQITHPDSSRKDRNAAARGDVPVLQFNSNLLKDELDARLDCFTPGQGMYLMPNWLPTSFFEEMCAEQRTSKGWEHTSGRTRNEAVDLGYMCIGLCLSTYIRIETWDWENPPQWAAPWDKNSLIRQPDEIPKLAHTIKSPTDFSKYAKALA